MLSERKMELECRVHAMLEENELLQNTVDNLRERTLVLEKQCHEKDLQVVLLLYRDNKVRYECTVFYKVIFWYFHNSLVKNVDQVLSRVVWRTCHWTGSRCRESGCQANWHYKVYLKVNLFFMKQLTSFLAVSVIVDFLLLLPLCSFQFSHLQNNHEPISG